MTADVTPYARATFLSGIKDATPTEVSGRTGIHAAPQHTEDSDFVQAGSLYRLMSEDE